MSRSLTRLARRESAPAPRVGRWRPLALALGLVACAARDPEGDRARGDGGDAAPAAPRFVQVRAGGAGTCALEDTGAVECWAGGLASRRGPFVELDVGYRHACARTPDARVECWGEDEEGSTLPPLGSFDRVRAAHDLSCALEGTRGRCWGSNRWERADVPDVALTELEPGWGQTCGLEPGGEARCWGSVEAAPPPPGGPLHGLTVGDSHACALDAAGLARCWGSGLPASSPPPPAPLSSVTAGALHTCGLTTDGAVSCWGDDALGQSAPPAGPFVAVDAGSYHTVAMTAEGRIVSFGLFTEGRPAPGE